MAKNVMKKLNVEKKGIKLSVTEKGKEGNCKMIASCGFLEEELRQCSKEGVTMADRGLEDWSKEVGSQRKSEEKEVQNEVLAFQEEQGLPEELHGDGESRSCYEWVWCLQGCRELVCTVALASTERLKLRRQMAAAAGKKSTTSLSLFMEAFGLEIEEELSTLATQYWAEAVWIGKWCLEQKRSLEESGFLRFRCGGK